MKVLIIDDSPHAIYLMAHYLAKHSIEVVSALSAEQGIERAVEESPDLIVCDIKMPRMDGIEFAKTIRRHPELSDIPLIAVTALALPSQRKHVLDAGFDGYFTKPLDTEAFVTKLLEYV